MHRSRDRARINCDYTGRIAARRNSPQWKTAVFVSDLINIDRVRTSIPPRIFAPVRSFFSFSLFLFFCFCFFICRNTYNHRGCALTRKTPREWVFSHHWILKAIRRVDRSYSPIVIIKHIRQLHKINVTYSHRINRNYLIVGHRAIHGNIHGKQDSFFLPIYRINKNIFYSADLLAR